MKGDWDVVLKMDDAGVLEGILVFHIRKYYGFRLILMPPMTAYNGIHIFYPADLKGHSKASFQNRVSEELVSRLPKHDLYYQQYHPDYDNWLALYWMGYKETTRYTYLLDSSPGKEENKANLRDNLRRSIKNADRHTTIVDIDLDTFLSEAEKAYATRKKELPIHKQVIRNLASAFTGSGKLHIRACRHNNTGQYISGAILAQDDGRTYYISSFYHAEAKPSGSMAHVIWEGIHGRTGKVFDFEGSILKDVEFYFRSFGGVLTPHYRIYKVPNFLLRKGLSLFKPDFFV